MAKCVEDLLQVAALDRGVGWHMNGHCTDEGGIFDRAHESDERWRARWSSTAPQSVKQLMVAPRGGGFTRHRPPPLKTRSKHESV